MVNGELDEFLQLKNGLSSEMLYAYLISLAKSGESQEPVAFFPTINF